MASTGRHGTVRGLPLKEVLEQVVPELNISCLRLALSTPKVTEQLLKLDEQGVSYVFVFVIAFCFLAYGIKLEILVIPPSTMPLLKLLMGKIKCKVSISLNS